MKLVQLLILILLFRLHAKFVSFLIFCFSKIILFLIEKKVNLGDATRQKVLKEHKAVMRACDPLANVLNDDETDRADDDDEKVEDVDEQTGMKYN